MSGLIGRNTRVEVQKTLLTAQTIISMTAASPPVIAVSGTTPADGSVVVLNDSLDGMVEIAGQAGRVANSSASPQTFEIESLRAASYSAFVASANGTLQVVSAWSTLGIARNVNQGSVNVNRIDKTTLLDSIKRYLIGQPDTPEITVDVISDPLTEASIIIANAAQDGSALVFRITLSDGSKRIFRGFVSLPSESIPVGDLLTGSFSIVQIGQRLAYAS